MNFGLKAYQLLLTIQHAKSLLWLKSGFSETVSNYHSLGYILQQEED